MSTATTEDVLTVLKAVKELDTKIGSALEAFALFSGEMTTQLTEVSAQLTEIRKVIRVLESDVQWSRDQIREHDQETTVLNSRLRVLENDESAA